MTCFSSIISVLVAALAPGFTYVLEDVASEFPTWPEEYHLRGEKIDYITGVMTPFEIWYSADSNRSRVDYDGGTVKHYYVIEDNITSEFMIYPMTTESLKHKIKCDKLNYKKSLYTILPNSDHYTFTGQKDYNNKLVDVWNYSEDKEIYEKKSEDTLYVFVEDDGNTIPVYLESKTHNLWTGVLNTHSVTRFYDYDQPQDEALDHTKEVSCKKKATTSSDLLEEDENLFNSYLTRHGKKYDGDEHELRKQIFLKNRRRVIQHNQQNLSYKLTLNKFSDRTDDELSSLRGTLPSLEHVGSVPFPHTEEEVEQLAKDLPKSFDLRSEGFISSVKNQDDCGSCWSFSVVSAVEGALARHNGGRNLDLSEQSLVDCAWGFNSYGCSGGFISDVYKYVLKYGIPTEMEYGLYLSKEGWCNVENMTELYNIKGFAAVPPLSVNAMKVALYKYGPVSVTINANDNVVEYNSGIFYDPKCNKWPLNHAVTVVGYGEREGVTYWIVKNSWGEDWGQDGYILISATDNNCHILEGAFYPVL